MYAYAGRACTDINEATKCMGVYQIMGGGGPNFPKVNPTPHIIQYIRECSLVTGMGWCFPRGVDVFLIAFFGRVDFF